MALSCFIWAIVKRRYSLFMICWKIAMCRLVSCCRFTLIVTYRCLSRRWSSRVKAVLSILLVVLTNRSFLSKVLFASFRRVFRWYALFLVSTVTVVSRFSMTKGI